MTDPNGNGFLEMKALINFRLDTLEQKVDAIAQQQSKLNCVVHAERLEAVHQKVKDHDKELDCIKGWRSQILGATAVVVILAQWLWTRLAKLL